tara:strand:- start:3251 stop:3448 length:198 start_codon:yes stop_codon:yes gene_type:complete
MGSKIHIALGDSERARKTKELLIVLTGEDKLQKSVTMDLIQDAFIKAFGRKRFNEIQLQFNKKDK